MNIKVIFIYLILILSGCEFKDTNGTKSHTLVDKMQENSIGPSIENEIQDLKLKRDKSFGETEDVFFSAMGDFTVDDSGRVYILDQGWGTRSLHVFNRDGSYLKKIAGEGRGPAEFLKATNLEYKN
ncbi:MAG: 6-bladed beta-propeller, partial [Flavobacteriaceae bacterium]